MPPLLGLITCTHVKSLALGLFAMRNPSTPYGSLALVYVYVLVLVTAAWYTQEPKLVWGVGLGTAIMFAGRQGVCEDCGFIAICPANARALPPAPQERPIERVTMALPAAPKTSRRPPPPKRKGKRAVPELRFADRIDHG